MKIVRGLQGLKAAHLGAAITIGSFGFFFLLFLGFIRLMPSMSIVEVKVSLAR